MYLEQAEVLSLWWKVWWNLLCEQSQRNSTWICNACSNKTCDQSDKYFSSSYLGNKHLTITCNSDSVKMLCIILRYLMCTGQDLTSLIISGRCKSCGKHFTSSLYVTEHKSNHTPELMWTEVAYQWWCQHQTLAR